MIAFTQSLDGGVPCFLFFLIPMVVIGSDIPNQARDLFLIFTLIVFLVELRTNFMDIGQRSVCFGEVEHLALDLRERKVLPLCFGGDQAHNIIEGFVIGMEFRHGENHIAVKCQACTIHCYLSAF